MEAFLTFFEELTTLQKLLWVMASLAFAWVLEGSIPLARLNYRKWRHAGVNFVFLATTMIINALFGLATVGLFLWIEQSQFGLLNWVSLPIWVELIIAVMAFDLIAQYVVHWMLHRYKWMWKFHMIHHSDTKVDATTGTRHHPGDYFMREMFALMAIIVVGAPLAFYLFYRILTIFMTYFTHANISIPAWLDRGISWVFISPNMHKFHHHFERPWTDSNYGNIFSLWDRAFGTLVYEDPRQIRYGLDVLDDATDEHVAYQFKIPFDKSIKTDY
ncbi:MAG: sterol desaturase family protein [Rhodothermales bacterium]|nr:sterol desaturase family protein [Rhodothermales bacterium]MBO6779238.1 sterol desaturase family protein [Rhodothermales bacterium]